LSEALPFSSGNPRIEETRGVMHLFSNDAVSDLPVCMLSVYVCVFGFDDEINDC
jgi:BRCA1-associated protein